MDRHYKSKITGYGFLIMPNNTKTDVLREACAAMDADGIEAARDVLHQGYPFDPQVRAGRKYTKSQCVALYLRDGFIDRYSGDRMVFPGALRVLSLVCPDVFPFHPNGKMEVCHMAWWELYPSIDHVVPIARGGADDESNWVTTSMFRNGVKDLWTLEELGWKLHPPGDIQEWDGQLAWFMRFMESDAHPGIDRRLPYLREWYRAAQAVTSKLSP